MRMWEECVEVITKKDSRISSETVVRCQLFHAFSIFK